MRKLIHRIVESQSKVCNVKYSEVLKNMKRKIQKSKIAFKKQHTK